MSKGSRPVRPVRRPTRYCPAWLLWAGLSWVFASTLPACAGPRGALGFSESRQLPGLGLQLHVMPGARERPLPTPHIYTYQVRTPTNTYALDMFDPHELWVSAQQAAEWVDGGGNAMVVATVRTP